MIEKQYVIDQLKVDYKEEYLEGEFKILFESINKENNYIIRYLLMKYYCIFEVLYMYDYDENKYRQEIINTNYHPKELCFKVLEIRQACKSNANRKHLTYTKKEIEYIYYYLKDRKFRPVQKTIAATLLYNQLKEKLYFKILNMKEDKYKEFKLLYDEAIQDNDYFYVLYSEIENKFYKVNKVPNKSHDFKLHPCLTNIFIKD